MEAIPRELQLKILEDVLSSVSDLSEVKQICSVNKEFNEICNDDYLWYLVYKNNIEPEVLFQEPFDRTWKRSILNGITVFTTDKLLSDGVEDFLIETLSKSLYGDELDESIRELKPKVVNMLTTYLENIIASNYSICKHVFGCFWWSRFNSDNFELDLNLRNINTLFDNYDTEMDNFWLEKIINPYGKLISLHEHDLYSLWFIRGWWNEKYNINTLKS